MKQLFTLAFIVLSIPILAQQVPNGGFEEWESTPMFSFDPVGWETDNTQLLVSASQDLEAYEGQYAMRIDPLNFGIGEYGEASTTVLMSGLPAGLLFYVKYQRTFTAGVGITVEFFNNEELVHSEYWNAADTVSAWMPVQMIFPPIDIATTHAVIRVFVAIGDFAPGEGWVSVDAMDFGAPTGVNDLEFTEFDIYPNPADQYLEISTESDALIDEVEIFDLNGRTVLNVPYSRRLDISTVREGQYFIELRMEGAIVGRKTFLVQR